MQVQTRPETNGDPVAAQTSFQRVAFSRNAQLSVTVLLSVFLFMFGRASASVPAEYRIVELQTDPRFPGAGAWAISDGNVAGNANVPFTHAVWWSAQGGAYTDLTPQPSAVSFSEDIDGNRVVGWGGRNGSANHALLWSGTAASMIDLHPNGWQFSNAFGIRGRQVVGRAFNIQNDIADVHALMWPDGTPGNVVDLHPRGYVQSGAVATTGTRQGGYGVLNGNTRFRPLLWSGTPESVVDLLPPGIDGGSVAAMSGNQQVGSVGWIGGLGSHAMLWTGTAASAVDLHPAAGFTETTAQDTNGRQQVGYGQGDVTGGVNHALLWNGENVVEDLHRFLPAGAVDSFAMGIDDDGTIVGAASFDGRSRRAVMWVLVPDPAGCAIFMFPAGLLFRPRRRMENRR